jgi:hypothetical protein
MRHQTLLNSLRWLMEKRKKENKNEMIANYKRLRAIQLHAGNFMQRRGESPKASCA